MNVIASRSFTVEDQAAFAAFSGDHNPMHMDPVAARRTQAGAPVVHGVHTLLWALDQLAASGLPFTNLATIAVQFSRFVYLNQAVTLTLPRRDDRSATAELVRDGLTLSTISLRFGPRADKDLPPNLLEAPDTIVADPLPNAPSLDDIATLRGWMPPVSAPISAHAIAPSLIEAIGLPRVRGFGLLSRLVGMICPGMHSIFTGIRVDLVSRAPDRAGVGFAVGVLDQRFRVARINVAGDGLLGTITAAVRWPPIETPSLATLASHVAPGRFAGSSALVVGGSRGLGALTAKLLAIGGARVIVTYATGKDDAASLATDLNGAFGPDTCRTLQFDVLADLPPQLASLPHQVDRLYYFATTQIYRPKRALFDPARFAEFNRVYVDAFHALCVHLLEGGRNLTAFYPSTVFVVDRPEQMTEYAMSKAAGEVLCADMARHLPGLKVVAERLPRMLTDQTASITPVETADPLAVMLPLIEAVQT